MLPEPEHLSVPVDGGTLAVSRWGRGETVVLAPHGITANRTSWALVADELGDDVTLLAPDLRGRGDSAALPGPFGMAAHARDLIAVLDHVGGDRALVAGHSMGGFVAVRAALDHGDRLTGLVLVDGGLAIEVPAGLDIDAVLHAVIGPAMERLSMTWGTREDYHGYWRPHPALQDDWGDLIEAYLDHDVHEVEGRWASRVNADAIRADGRDTLVDESLRRDLPSITLPMRLIRAPRGLLNADPLYPAEVVRAFVDAVPALSATDADDVNHYTILLSRHGAKQVAAEIRTALGVS